MKRHSNVFVIADPEFRNRIKPIPELEKFLASESVRAICFDSVEVKKLGSGDWGMSTALTGAMIRTCDAVAVVGGDITPQMLDEIHMAMQEGKEICVTDFLKEKAEKCGVPFSNRKLSSVCKETLELSKK